MNSSHLNWDRDSLQGESAARAHLQQVNAAVNVVANCSRLILTSSLVDAEHRLFLLYTHPPCWK